MLQFAASPFTVVAFTMKKTSIAEKRGRGIVLIHIKSIPNLPIHPNLPPSANTGNKSIPLVRVLGINLIPATTS